MRGARPFIDAIEVGVLVGAEPEIRAPFPGHHVFGGWAGSSGMK
jgi:hypothetical protein